MRKLATWTFTRGQPKTLGRIRGRARWMASLWAEVQKGEEVERLESDIRPERSVSLGACIDLAAGELWSMVVDRELIDCGFDVYLMPRRR